MQNRASMYDMATKCDASPEYLPSLQRLAAQRCYLIEAFTLSLLSPFPSGLSNAQQRKRAGNHLSLKHWILTGQQDKRSTVPGCRLIPALYWNHCKWETLRLLPRIFFSSMKTTSDFSGDLLCSWGHWATWSSCAWERKMAMPSYL